MAFIRERMPLQVQAFLYAGAGWLRRFFMEADRQALLHNRLRVGQAEYPITWLERCPPGRDVPREWGKHR